MLCSCFSSNSMKRAHVYLNNTKQCEIPIFATLNRREGRNSRSGRFRRSCFLNVLYRVRSRALLDFRRGKVEFSGKEGRREVGVKAEGGRLEIELT